MSGFSLHAGFLRFCTPGCLVGWDFCLWRLMTTWILLPIRYSLCLSPGKHKTTMTYTTVCSVQEMFMEDHCPGAILVFCLCKRKIPFSPVQTLLSGLSKRTV